MTPASTAASMCMLGRGRPTLLAPPQDPTGPTGLQGSPSRVHLHAQASRPCRGASAQSSSLSPGLRPSLVEDGTQSPSSSGGSGFRRGGSATTAPRLHVLSPGGGVQPRRSVGRGDRQASSSERGGQPRRPHVQSSRLPGRGPTPYPLVTTCDGAQPQAPPEVGQVTTSSVLLMQGP